MSKINASTTKLRTQRKRLERQATSRPLDANETEALAESGFRIAVHRDTHYAEAVNLLCESMRLDGTNPKYAYHLARLHYVYGRLDETLVALQQACELCPTSHRIWTHICLLQWELNARYYGNDDYEPNALKKERTTRRGGDPARSRPSSTQS